MCDINPMISVIIPVYNVERFLRICIHSVLCNTYKNLQVICIDDGSIDHSGDILDEMAASDPRLLVIHQRNRGVSAARNTGLENAYGDFIAFIDSDDLIHYRYFETMLNCIMSRKADVVACGCRKISEEETPEQHNYRHISYTRLNDRDFFNQYYVRHMVWAKLYRRSGLREERFAEKVRIAEDTIFNLHVVGNLQDPVVYGTKEELYYYRVRSNSIVHTAEANNMIDVGNWYMSRKDREIRTAGAWGWLIEMEILKAVLSYRHTMKFVRRDQEQVRYSDHILEVTLKELRNRKKHGIIDLVVMYLMVTYPHLYRLYRIVQDPSMLKWEKQSRSRRD